MAGKAQHYKGDDSGPEYISVKLLIWDEKRGITIQHILTGQHVTSKRVCCQH